MAFLDRPAPRTLSIPGPQHAFAMMARQIKRRRKRAEIAAMLELEDWVLKDLGVTRMDVHEALSYRGDPSLHLRTLVARRRFWTRNRDSI